ncbi:chromate transporter [Acetivibrio ethanolgignens]|uniref:Chromate transporter n=1 Tax=Acetivibrio ethanolgignens TaxID=290052 RepID=A0A0V8QBU9_9FIRM|nr:chromate transporter [Acetivibrio ethanolgignens]KSV57561.1 chromate transporter [Acetivibrio ethanolgignens]
MLYLELFWTFFKIGAFTFGGGYAMLPLIQAEVNAHGWMSKAELVNFVAVSESTPGPFAVNVSTYVGMETGGLFGALCATLGVVLPSFFIILVVSRCFEKFKNSSVVKGCMSGLKPAVIGLIGAAVISVGKTVFFSEGVSLSLPNPAAFGCSAALFLGILFLIFKKKLHPIAVVSLSAVAGIVLGYLGVV